MHYYMYSVVLQESIVRVSHMAIGCLYREDRDNLGSGRRGFVVLAPSFGS